MSCIIQSKRSKLSLPPPITPPQYLTQQTVGYIYAVWTLVYSDSNTTRQLHPILTLPSALSVDPSTLDTFC